jgi:hypothetical protein
MDGYHSISQQWMLIIAYTYNGRLPLHLLTIDGYYSIYLQWVVAKTSTYNGRLITIASIYFEWVP